MWGFGCSAVKASICTVPPPTHPYRTSACVRVSHARRPPRVVRRVVLQTRHRPASTSRQAGQSTASPPKPWHFDVPRPQSHNLQETLPPAHPTAPSVLPYPRTHDLSVERATKSSCATCCNCRRPCYSAVQRVATCRNASTCSTAAARAASAPLALGRGDSRAERSAFLAGARHGAPLAVVEVWLRRRRCYVRTR
jgi:hypothetical protein